MKWNKYFDGNLPEVGKEVLAYNHKWIDEDYNPRGFRIGFIDGEGSFRSAYWWDEQDTYISISKEICESDPDFYSEHIGNTEPEYWIELPNLNI